VDESVVDVDHQRYVDAVISEIEMESSFGPLDAVNFGGGTPSLLAATRLGQIIEELRRRFAFNDDVEVSLEVNPEDLTEEVARALRAVGFTRVSVGAQSFDGQILGALGRRHGVGAASDAVRSARDAGFRTVSLDLIYGHPSESDRSWAQSIDRALGLPLDHLSTYSLTVERGTALSRQILDGATPPDGDVQAMRFEMLCERSSAAGFDRYEVSNHARPGHACVYNLSTWAHGEYLGFGLGAHDHRWGRRSRNHQRLDRYLEIVEAGSRPRVGSEELDAFAEERDRFMLGVRLAAGTPMSRFAYAFLASPEGRRMVDLGLVVVRDDRVVVTEPMLTDAVAREALSVSVDDC
jgi:oxygen-independent coproporphyrinogen-3 oxidase